MHVVIEYAPSLLERLADLITQEMSRSVEQDPDRFKALAEGHDVEANPHAADRVGALGAAVEQARGSLGLGDSNGPGVHYAEADPNAGYQPGHTRQDHQGGVVADTSDRTFQ